MQARKTQTPPARLFLRFSLATNVIRNLRKIRRQHRRVRDQ